jgi:hypothetical protein
MDFNVLAFRILMILKMNELLNEDVAHMKRKPGKDKLRTPVLNKS